jgi:hypothetical protein
MTEHKNAQRERLLSKQDEMRKSLPGQLSWIAGMIFGFLVFQLVLGLLGLLLA